MAEIIAKSRYVRSTPRKLRAVAALVKSKGAEESLVVLKYTNKKAAGLLAKTIKSAVANAVNNFNLEKENLIIKSIRIDQGPTLKRFIAMARGSGNRFKKHTSHITVILFTPDTPQPKVQPKPEPVQSTEEDQAATSDKPKTKATVKSKSTAKKTAKTKTEKPKGSKTTVSVKSRKDKK